MHKSTKLDSALSLNYFLHPYMKKTIILSLLMIICSNIVLAGTKKEYILCINSNTDASPWSNRMILELSDYALKHPELDLRIEHIRQLFVNNQDEFYAFREDLRENYGKDDKPKVLVLLGGFAYALRDEYKKLWGDIPMIVYASRDYVAEKENYISDTFAPKEKRTPILSTTSEYNSTFLYANLFIRESIYNLLYVYPNTKEIIFIRDVRQLNHDIEDEINEILKTYHPAISLNTISPKDMDTNHLLDKLNNINADSTAILFSSWNYAVETRQGLEVNSSDNLLISICKTPIFTLNYADITTHGGRMHSGFSFDFNEFKNQLSEVLNKIIYEQIEPRNIPFYYPTRGKQYVLCDIAFSRGKTFSDYPSNSVFLNAPPPIFEQYRSLIILLLVLLSTIAIAALIRMRMIKLRENSVLKEKIILEEVQLAFDGMPIAFTELKLLFDKAGKVIDFIYTKENSANSHYRPNDGVILNRKGTAVLPELLLDKILLTLNKLINSGEKQTLYMHWPQIAKYVHCEYLLSAKEGYVNRFIIDQTQLISLKEEALKANKKNELILENIDSLLAYVTEDHKILWSNADSALSGAGKNIYKEGEVCYVNFGLDKPCNNCPVVDALATNRTCSGNFKNAELGWVRSTAIPMAETSTFPKGVILRIENVSEYINTIADLNLSMKVGMLLRWKFEFNNDFSIITTDEGIDYQYFNNSTKYIKEGKRSLFRYLLNLKNGIQEKTHVDLCVHSKLHKKNRNYRFKAVLQTNTSGKPIGFFGVLKDITEETKLHKDIISLQNNMLLALEVGQIDTWRFDLQTNILTILLGQYYIKDTDQGISLEAFIANVHPDDRGDIERIYSNTINKKTKQSVFKYRFKTPLGWEYFMGSCIAVIENEVVTSLIGVRRNITKEVEYQKYIENKMLQVSEQGDELLSILENLPFPIALLNLETNTYTYTNRNCIDLYDIIKGDQPSYKIISSTIKKEEIEPTKRAGTYEAEETIKLKDGKVVESLVKSIRIEYEKAKHALISRIDLTAFNRTKKEAQLFTDVMPSIKAYTFYYDNNINFLRLQHNLELERDINQFTKIDQFLEAMHIDDREQFIATTAWQMTAEISKIKEFQFRLDIEKRGVYEWWEAHTSVEIISRNGKESRILRGITINVHERKKTEIDLLRLNSQNSLILTNTSSALIFLSSEYDIVWSNADTALGGMIKNIYKSGVKKCYQARGFNTPCEDCPVTRAFLTQHIEEEEYDMGNNIWIKATIVPVSGVNGLPDGAVLRIDDVSEYKKMIGILDESKEKAEEADKLKSAFLANMSHEIRTPLNAIVGFSELLQFTEDAAEKEQYVNIINTNNDLLLRLISDILDLSKIESGSVELSPETFDFSSFIHETYTTLKPRCEKSEVDLILDNPYNKCMVTLDKNRCLQIITNFLNNAVKFTVDGYIKVGYQHIDDGLKIFVEDSGIGIPKKKQDRLFNRFAKLNDFAQGTGLGLSICKAIAETMNGNVGVESTEGKGSTFWAWFPCKAEIELVGTNKVELPKNERSVAQEDVTIIKNILVAEDNDSNYMLVNAMLKGCNLTRALNGYEAVSLAKQFKYDIILMDMKMPKMGGLEATQKIREFDTETVIIAVTANAFDSDRDQALKAGCNAFVTKPLKRKDLETSICGGRIKNLYIGNISPSFIIE